MKIVKKDISELKEAPYNPRLHHLINWDKTVPKIISDKYRKN